MLATACVKSHILKHMTSSNQSPVLYLITTIYHKKIGHVLAYYNNELVNQAGIYRQEKSHKIKKIPLRNLVPRITIRALVLDFKREFLIS